MQVHRATLADIDQIVPLFDAYRVWYGKPSDVELATDFLTERLVRNESVIFLAKSNTETPAGFTQCYPMFSSTRMRRMWVLNDLFVAPEYRSQGISKQIIDATKTLARSTDAVGVMLETEPTNEIGNRLYPRVGFERENNNFYFWTNEI